MGESSNPLPSVGGVQSHMFMPLPTYTTANRGVPGARADRAGTIASRSGSARVAPMPRRNVRLGSASFVITIVQLLSSELDPSDRVPASTPVCARWR